uniref:Uncharacterized protein n=1 Tax=Cannabis sativa TaxID=3483 RepID=A0A803NJX9_CANSA
MGMGPPVGILVWGCFSVMWVGTERGIGEGEDLGDCSRWFEEMKPVLGRRLRRHFDRDQEGFGDPGLGILIWVWGIGRF